MDVLELVAKKDVRLCVVVDRGSTFWQPVVVARRRRELEGEGFEGRCAESIETFLSKAMGRAKEWSVLVAGFLFLVLFEVNIGHVSATVVYSEESRKAAATTTPAPLAGERQQIALGHVAQTFLFYRAAGGQTTYPCRERIEITAAEVDPIYSPNGDGTASVEGVFIPMSAVSGTDKSLPAKLLSI